MKPARARAHVMVPFLHGASGMFRSMVGSPLLTMRFSTHKRRITESKLATIGPSPKKSAEAICSSESSLIQSRTLDHGAYWTVKDITGVSPRRDGARVMLERWG